MNLLDIRPYLLRAHLAWLEDSAEIPHLAIANGENVSFPPAWKDHVMVVFNVSAEAVQYCHVDGDGIAFMARFNGQPFEIRAPLNALLWLANKTGTIQIPMAPLENTMPTAPVEAPPAKPRFTLVQGGKSESSEPRPHLHVVPKETK